MDTERHTQVFQEQCAANMAKAISSFSVETETRVSVGVLVALWERACAVQPVATLLAPGRKQHISYTLEHFGIQVDRRTSGGCAC